MMKDYSHCTKLGSEVVSLAAASSAAHPIQHSYGQLFFDGTSGPEEGFKTCVVWSPTIRERDGLFCRIGYLGVFSLSLSLSLSLRPFVVSAFSAKDQNNYKWPISSRRVWPQAAHRRPWQIRWWPPHPAASYDECPFHARRFGICIQFSNVSDTFFWYTLCF
jgi:hypothetical protein